VVSILLTPSAGMNWSNEYSSLINFASWFFKGRTEELELAVFKNVLFNVYIIYKTLLIREIAESSDISSASVFLLVFDIKAVDAMASSVC
jgi:hypothetical protein